MMAQDSSEGRQVFQRQPARTVLIDFSPPLSVDTVINIQQALSNAFTLLNNVSGGPVRVPFIGIIVLGNYPECTYPLQPLKGNTARLTTALKELGALARNMVARQRPSRGCVLEGLQEALAQFNRLSQNYRQGTGSASFPAQIDLTLLTSQSSSAVRGLVERAADHLDLEHLKKISGVCVSDPERLLPTECPSSQTDDMSHITSSPTELGLSMLDLVSIDNDVLSLQNVFQGWLLDCGTDSEHLHLSLPPVFCPGEEDEFGLASHSGTVLTLKCDMQERLLDPCTITGGLGQHFGLNASSLPPVTTNRGSTNASLRSTSLPIYKLKATALVATDGICESVVFGSPHVLRPTACWKLDWGDLEMNQQRFNALCQLLQDKSQVLIAKTSSPSLSPHFVILPSDSQTLLIKSLAVSEIMLPMETPTAIEQPSNAIQQTVAESLGKLECYDTYNPLLTPCGLYDTLNQPKRSNLTRQPPRSSYQTPPTAVGRGRAAGRGTGGMLGTGGRRNYQKKGLGFQ